MDQEPKRSRTAFTSQGEHVTPDLHDAPQHRTGGAGVGPQYVAYGGGLDHVWKDTSSYRGGGAAPGHLARTTSRGLHMFSPYKRGLQFAWEGEGGESSEPVPARNPVQLLQDVAAVLRETRLILKVASLAGLPPDADAFRFYGGAAGVGSYFTYKYQEGSDLVDTARRSFAATGNAGGELMAFGWRGGGGGNLSTDPNQTGIEAGGGGVCGGGVNSVTGPAVGCNIVMLFEISMQRDGGIAIGMAFRPGGPVGRHLDPLLNQARAKLTAALKGKLGGYLDGVNLNFYWSLSVQNPHAKQYTAPPFEVAAQIFQEANEEAPPIEERFSGIRPYMPETVVAGSYLASVARSVWRRISSDFPKDPVGLKRELRMAVSEGELASDEIPVVHKALKLPDPMSHDDGTSGAPSLTPEEYLVMSKVMDKVKLLHHFRNAEDFPSHDDAPGVQYVLRTALRKGQLHGSEIPVVQKALTLESPFSPVHTHYVNFGHPNSLAPKERTTLWKVWYRLEDQHRREHRK